MLVTALSSTSCETRMKHRPSWEGMEFSTRRKYLFQRSFERIMMSGDVIYVNSFMLKISSSAHDSIHDIDPTVTNPLSVREVPLPLKVSPLMCWEAGRC